MKSRSFHFTENSPNSSFRAETRSGTESQKREKTLESIFFGISPLLRGSPWIDVIQRIDRAVTNKYPSIITFILRMGCYSQKINSIERSEIALWLSIYSSSQNGHLLLNEWTVRQSLSKVCWCRISCQNLLWRQQDKVWVQKFLKM